ncbi:MAG: spore coat protein CotJB [Clostridia bacterium]|nr:spore coat protein CotJB [Clostridia bacterium]
MNDQQKLLNKLSVAQFAAWELHLYLDTHPCDASANEMFRKYTTEATLLKKEYESKYGPLTVSASNEADWLESPWPWENERSCD